LGKIMMCMYGEVICKRREDEVESNKKEEGGE
jgi:hypothetical protein